MGYTVNGQELSLLAECQSKEDGRIESVFNDKFTELSDMKYVSLADEFDYSESCNNFLVNNQAVLAKKGTRPNTNLRCDVAVPGLYYLTKFTDGEVWLLDNYIKFNDNSTARKGHKISDSNEDLQYVFLGLFGAGGGASGGNAIVNVNGRGGASGGAIFALVKLTHEEVIGICEANSLPLYCGAGGNGCTGSNSAQSGKYTGLYNGEGLPCIYASGGGGAQGEKRGIASKSEIKDLVFVTDISIVSGANAGVNGLVGESVIETTTTRFAPIGENGSITFGGYANDTGGRAGAGGNGPLGKGGNSYDGNGDWGDNGQLTGGGGGGNYKTFGTTRGGNGGHGTIRVYY